MATAATQDPSLVKKDAHPFERAQLEGLMTKRFFYTQAFEIYGGVAGLYDYGPSGASLQANIISHWRNHFIIEEDMLELDTTIMTLSDVLKTSGHVDKFADWMVKDVKSGDIYRADHMIENVLEARLKGDEDARKREAGVQTSSETAPPAEDKKSKKNAKVIEDTIMSMSQDCLQKLQKGLEAGKATVSANGETFEVTKEHVEVEYKTIKESVRNFIPNVIEPSFGIGRIFYALLEHAFWAREEDKERGVLSLPPLVAPFKVLIVPISSNEQLSPIARDISKKLRSYGIASRIDDSSATIGRRYARNDELGTPFACTIDFASVSKGTITLRERDTTSQRIGSIDEVLDVITNLCHGRLDWHGACQILPAYTGTQDVDAQ